MADENSDNENSDNDNSDNENSDNDNGDNDNGENDDGENDDDSSGDEAAGRGEEVGGGTGEAKEVKERSDDQQAPLPGALPGPVDLPDSSTKD